MVTVKNLEKLPIETIYSTFVNAFSDYAESFKASCEHFEYLLARRAYNPELSFGAFVGEKMVGFILNGFAEWHGKPTAYDTGTGVIKGFRKQGIATQIFNESLPILRENNITQYLLEVIKSNTSAYNLYHKAGFKITREFNYYISSKKNLNVRKKRLGVPFSIRPIENPDWNVLCSFWDFYPSWQNSIDAIKRKKNHFTILGIWAAKSLAGYGIIERHSGDIPHIAIKKSYRRKGLATILFANLIALLRINEVSVINTRSDYEPFNNFARSINLNPGPGQYEMLLSL